jgi:outer membrane protein, heavy metal efflux system
MNRFAAAALLALATLTLAQEAAGQDSSIAQAAAPRTAAAQAGAATQLGSAQAPAAPTRILAADTMSVEATAQPGAAATALTLADLEQRALAQNPAIAVAAAQVDAAKGRAVQAGALPNPTIGYTGDEISGGSINRGGEHGFFVEQTIPLGGKLGRGRDVYTREAATAQAMTETERQRVLTAVRRTYRAAVIADRRVAVREQLARLAAETVQISAQLLNTGVADKPDTLSAEVESQRAQLALAEARNDRLRIWRELGVLVGDPALAPRPLAGSADDPLPDLTQDATLARLQRESPEIEAARRDIARANAALSRARRVAAPDLVLRAGPRYNRELLERDLKPVGWEGSFEVGVTVPLFNRNAGGIAEASADLARSQAAVRQTTLAATSRMADAFAQYETARRRVEVYRREILPRADEAYAMYRRNYAQMAAAYPQVLAAQRTLIQSQDQYLDALDRAWAAATALEGFALDLAH